VWLERALHIVERFFGDDNSADHSLIQRVLGISRPVALWTAPALDRCILFAFIYPQALLILGWAMTGSASRAESVLGLAPEPDASPRYITMGAIAAAVFGYSKCYKILAKVHDASQKPDIIYWLRFSLWLTGLLVAALVIAHFLGHGPGAVGGSIILSSSIVRAAAGDVLIAIAGGFVGAALGIVVLLHYGVFSAAIVAAATCCGIGLAESALCGKGSGWWRLRNRLRKSQGFWWLFLATAIVFYTGLYQPALIMTDMPIPAFRWT
jgi:hypothetical protein